MLRSVLSGLFLGLASLFLSRGTQALPDIVEPGDEFFVLGPQPASENEAKNAAAKISDSIIAAIRKNLKDIEVNSTYRLSSKAHQRGAVDLSGTAQDRAKAISAILGKKHLVIVEEKTSGSTQTNTYYCGGKMWRPNQKPNPEKGTRLTAFSSSGKDPSHTHIQLQPEGQPTCN